MKSNIYFIGIITSSMVLLASYLFFIINNITYGLILNMFAIICFIYVNVLFSVEKSKNGAENENIRII